MSGVINMFEAPKVLRESFKDLTKKESHEIFSLWAKDSKRHEKK
jgi:hypothetical protein